MRLTLHTDFALRVLMFLAALEPAEQTTVQKLADAYGISSHHLQKVVQTLRRMELVETTLGRSGGIRLAKPASAIRLGALIQSLEGHGELVSCLAGPCPLSTGCGLKGALDDAELAFYRQLDQRVLADVVPPTMRKMITTMRQEPRGDKEAAAPLLRMRHA